MKGVRSEWKRINWQINRANPVEIDRNADNCEYFYPIFEQSFYKWN